MGEGQCGVSPKRPGNLQLGSKVVELLLKQRRPMLMVDFVHAFHTDRIPTIESGRHISMNEPFFEGHFPDMPIWPGALSLEGLEQSATILTVLTVLTRAASEADDDPERVLESLRNLDRGYRRRLEVHAAGVPRMPPGLSRAVDGRLRRLHPLRGGGDRERHHCGRGHSHRRVDAKPPPKGIARSVPRPAVALLALACAACGPPRVWRGVSPDHHTDFEVFSVDGRSCVRFGMEPRTCYDAVTLPHITFSKDSRSVAFPVRESDEWFVVHDGRPGPAAQGIGGIALSPDGARLAYVALRDSAWHVVVDGAYGEPFDAVFSRSLTFDPSGRHVAFAAERDGRVAVVIDGSIGPGHDGMGDVTFSPDGWHVGYVARDGATARLIVDGNPGAEHDAISEFRFAPSGLATAYLALDGDAWFIVHGDTRRGPYTTARALAYARGGNIIFVAGDGAAEHVVVNGSPSALSRIR